jgi:FkbM family methyltransferase
MFFSEIIRKIFHPYFISHSKRVLGISYRDDQFELNRISTIARYKQGNTNLIKNEFHFIDSESFINQFKDIWQKEILHFDSDNEAPLIIDCGSNIGLSVCYFKKKFPKSRIIAFEPDPKIFKTLTQNTKEFDKKNLKLLNLAVWNRDSTLSFCQNGADGGTLSKEGNIVVNTVNLSDYLNQKIDFLKIDIEGAESVVLPSIESKLHNVKNLFLELHVKKDQPELLETTCSILRKNKFRYKIETVGNTNFRSFVQTDNDEMQLNFFAINENP